MAKVKRNPLLRGLSGALGKSLVFRQMRDGSTVLSEKPNFEDREFSPGQLRHQSRFQQAAAYARGAARVHPIYGELTQGTLQTAYNLALSDWFKPPVIHGIQRQAGCIRVAATDNVHVTKVLVMILDEEGGIVEQGEAIRGELGLWEYETATEGRVRVEAWDLAGNVTRQELEQLERSQGLTVLCTR
ncbi:MAG TPA: hypothetical protein VK249_31640 [Anaerolineales bacterium]|nr:hypothetical protein [Anaerolineales bacterium]